MSATGTKVSAHLGRVNGSLYCYACKGDMLNGTCTCGHDLCRECIGCMTCNHHDRGCSQHPRNQEASD